MRRFHFLVSTLSIMATTGCAGRITGFVSKTAASGEYAFANADRDYSLGDSQSALSKRLKMGHGTAVIARHERALTFEIEDQESPFQGLIGGGLGTALFGQGEPAADGAQIFDLEFGWVFFWGMRPHGRTKMVRAYAAHTDFSMRILPASGSDPERHQIFLRSSGERDTPPVAHELTVTCIDNTSVEQVLTCSAEPCGGFLEVIFDSTDKCKFELVELNPLPDTARSQSAREFVEGVKKRLVSIKTSPSPLPDVPPG